MWRLKLFTRDPKVTAATAGRFGLYLLEPLDFVLQLHLPGPAAEVRQSGGRAPTASRPLRLQFEHVQMLQFSTQVFYQLETDTARRSEERQSKNKLRTRTNSVPNWWQTKGKKRRRNGPSHLLHFLLFLLELLSVLSQLVHHFLVEVHLVLQTQACVFQLVCHPLFFLVPTQTQRRKFNHWSDLDLHCLDCSYWIKRIVLTFLEEQVGLYLGIHPFIRFLYLFIGSQAAAISWQPFRRPIKPLKINIGNICIRKKIEKYDFLKIDFNIK